MSIQRRQRRRKDGRSYTVWRVRWYDVDGRERSRTFDRAADAQAFEAKVRTLKRADTLAGLDVGKETFAEFAEQWWELYARLNLARNTLTVERGSAGPLAPSLSAALLSEPTVFLSVPGRSRLSS